VRRVKDRGEKGEGVGTPYYCSNNKEGEKKGFFYTILSQTASVFVTQKRKGEERENRI